MWYTKQKCKKASIYSLQQLYCNSQYVWKNDILFRVVSGKIIYFSTPKCLESLENWCLKTCGNPVLCIHTYTLHFVCYSVQAHTDACLFVCVCLGCGGVCGLLVVFTLLVVLNYDFTVLFFYIF